MRVRLSQLFLLSASLLAGQTNGPTTGGTPQRPEGVRPRGTAAVYASQVQTETATVAASVLTPEQVKQRFAFDVSKSYVVVELAIYPVAGHPAVVQDGDFRIRLSNQSELVDPVEAATVAANIQQKNTPARSTVGRPVYSEVNAGYGRGTDPYTGRPVSSVYLGGGVATASPDPNPYPAPGGFPEDRALLEEQLWHRSLPEGSVTQPVAGYLYFPTSLLKKEKGYYLVEIQGESGRKSELRVPLAKR
jgi:hypothetical protein